MKTLWHTTADHAADYLDTVARRPVKATATSAELRSTLGGALPDSGVDPALIINDLATAGRTGTVASTGPRYFGFVVGGALPAAVCADWLVSAWDQNAGIYALSPLAAVVEDITAGWLKDLAGLPPSMSVGFVTGCQMANFTALAAARHHVLGATGWDVESNGLLGAPPVTILTSEESHYTIFMALRLLGFGGARAVRVPADGQGRMRADALANALGATSGATIVCAQAGNVNTGAFDPLGPIADHVANARRDGRPVWLHVDGAFGLWAAAAPERSRLVAGIHRADSIATDAHKWLNVPYDSGLVFTAHPGAHRGAMSLSAAYIQATGDERDPHEFVPEESRRGRAVPVYAALRSLGRQGLADLVERCCRHAEDMATRLRAVPGIDVLNDVVLNQVLVRFGDDDAITRDVIARVQDDGTCWLGGTTWHGLAAMRIAISNWSTTPADIERSAAAIISSFASRR